MTEQRTAPRTAAGRALLELPTFDKRLRASILAIEAEAAEQSGPLDVEALAEAMAAAGEPTGMSEQDRRYWRHHSGQIREAANVAAEYARLIPQPAQPAREPLPLTGHIHQPQDCPWCKALVELGRETALALAEEAQPADTALREALEDYVRWSEAILLEAGQHLIPQPAQPANLVRCPECDGQGWLLNEPPPEPTEVQSDEPAQPADTALREALDVLSRAILTYRDGDEIHRMAAEARTLLAFQPSSSEPENER